MYKENQSKEDKKVLQKILQNQTFAEPEENSEASAIFYYHADHLGSNEIISDNTGAPHEFHLTLPFGETMAEQRKPVADYYNSWKFTGKELDEETGLYYFGARYYQPSWSVWLSVDPLADVPKQIGFSPYHFSANNPINYIDPDGRCFQKVGDEYVPCDEADVGSTTTGAFGNNWTMSEGNGWQLTNGADPNTVNYEYDFISSNPNIQIKKTDFQKAAYETHIPAYTKNGTIGQLKVPDLWKIMWTPDLKDSWGNPDGRKQILGMFPHVLQGQQYPDGYWDPERNPGNILINPGPK